MTHLCDYVPEDVVMGEFALLSSDRRIQLLTNDESGADVNAKDKQGQSAFHYAVQKGDLAIVRLLFEKVRRFQSPSLLFGFWVRLMMFAAR